MKQVSLSTLGAPLKLLYIQFLAEITQMFACETSFHAEALGLALLFPSFSTKEGKKEKQVLESHLTASPPSLISREGSYHCAIPFCRGKPFSYAHNSSPCSETCLGFPRHTLSILFLITAVFIPAGLVHCTQPSELHQQQPIKSSTEYNLVPSSRSRN